MSSNVMIEATNLSKHYGTFKALDDVSFQVRQGEILGFLGPNGAGKTTTMKILTCFIAPTSGSARVAGFDVFDDALSVRHNIGYLPESTPLYGDMLVSEYLEWVAQMRSMTDKHKHIDRVVEQTSLKEKFSAPIHTLSKGYKQRVGLAQALLHQPSILILDEPLSGLDPNQAAEVREVIKEIGQERTVILSTHNLAEVTQTCGRVLIVSGGKIVADDSPDKLMAGTGKARYQVQARGLDPQSIQKHLAGIEGVANVSVQGDVSDSELVVHADTSEDLREAIFKSAVHHNFILLGLEQHAENLEDVFHQLTTQSGTTTSMKKGDV